MRLEIPVFASPRLRALLVRVAPLVRSSAEIRFAMQANRPARIEFSLPVQSNRMSLSLPAVTSPTHASIALETPVISIPVTAMTFATGDGAQIFDAIVKHDSTGSIMATFRMETRPSYGERIALVLNKSVVIFSGIVTEVRTTAGEIGYSVTLADEIKALADSKITVPEAEDVAVAFREALEEYGVQLYDESQKTYFPTYYTGEEIPVKTLKEIMESCRGAKLTLLPEGGYVLSNTPRRWILDQGKCFRCTDVVDVSGYANRIIVFVDEEYTKWIEALEDTTKSYGGFTVRTKAKGEQVHYLRAVRGSEALAEESSEWSERHFLIAHSATKDGVNTTTTYTIEEPEERVPYVSLRHMISVEVV